MVLKRRKLIKRISAIVSVVLLLFTFCVSVSGADYFDNRNYFAYPIFQSSNDATPDLRITQTVSIGDKINFVPIFDPTQLITVSDGTSRVYLPLPVIQGKQSVTEARRLFLDNTSANNDAWATLSASFIYFTDPYFNMELRKGDGLGSQILRIRANSNIANINNNRYLPEFLIYFRYIDENGDFVTGIEDKPTSAQRPDWVFYEYGDSTHTYGTYQIDTTVMNLTRPDRAKGIAVFIEASYYADPSYSLYESQPQYSQPYTAIYQFMFEDWDIQEAYSNGYNEGFNLGRFTGEEVGYQRGYREASEEVANYNAVSGLIQIAQLPSVFISSMLDFDVFGINILALVKHLFTLLLVAFVTVIFVRYIL